VKLLAQMRAKIRPDIRQAIDGFGWYSQSRFSFVCSTQLPMASWTVTGSSIRYGGGIRSIRLSSLPL